MKDQPEPNPTPIQSTSQSRSHTTTTWLLVAITTVLFGTSFYLGYRNFKLNQQILELEAQAESSQNQHQANSSELAAQAFINGRQERLTYLRIFNGTAVMETINEQADPDQSINIYITDSKLSKGSLVRVFTTESMTYNLNNVHRLPGPHHDYFVAQTQGVGVDFSIFTKDGQLVTQSVRQNNPELSDWHISYSGYNYENDTIEAVLFKIDDSHGTAEINPRTGKVVPGSLKIEG